MKWEMGLAHGQSGARGTGCASFRQVRLPAWGIRREAFPPHSEYREGRSRGRAGNRQGWSKPGLGAGDLPPHCQGEPRALGVGESRFLIDERGLRTVSCPQRRMKGTWRSWRLRMPCRAGLWCKDR